MDELSVDAFVYIVLLGLAILVALMWGTIDVLKDKVATLERQMRELHKMVIAVLPNEE
jgi:uncharacterized membrane protein affecting hemolysin expression